MGTYGDHQKNRKEILNNRGWTYLILKKKKKRKREPKKYPHVHTATVYSNLYSNMFDILVYQYLEFIVSSRKLLEHR